jgi:hypothetical protein
VIHGSGSLPQPQPDPIREPLPLYPGGSEPIVGHRIWRVELHEGRPRLCSVAAPTTWTPGEAIHAYCWPVAQVPRTSDHRAPWPDGGCDCGLWAFKQPDPPIEALWTYSIADLKADRHRGATVAWAVGTAKLWGRIVECENGWRAEHGYPSQVTLVDGRQLIEKVMGRIDVPVPVYRMEGMAAVLADDYGIPVDYASQPPVAPFDLAMSHSRHSTTVLPSGLVVTTFPSGSMQVSVPPMTAAERRGFRIASLVLFAACALAMRWCLGASALWESGLYLLLAITLGLGSLTAAAASTDEGLDFSADSE